MFKSKHSGWTWDLKRTPFGGGGGNFISDIGNSISNAVSGVSDTLASIDPGPAIGSGLAQVDQAVNQIPGGWITVGGLAAGGAALAYAPEVMALASSSGMTPEAAALSLGSAPIDVATGATVPLDTLAADIAPTTADIMSSTGFTPTAGSSFAIDPTAAYTTGVAPYAGDSQYAAQDVMQQARDTNVASGSPTSYDTATAGASDFGAANAAKLAKSLLSSSNSSLANSASNLATGQYKSASAIPGLIRGNQNPFIQTQSFQVSNKKPDLSTLIELLKQG